ncbi:MAG: PrsW family intramembrane metalloprotease [Methanomicrobiales archaeon]|nr:PrsW family intramembrane metalloprotease [Methanomicrobiales archaeon]
MEAVHQLLTIAIWEIKRFSKTMTRDLLPVAIVLLVLLVAVSGFTAQKGIHLQDGMYRIGIDSPIYLDIIGSDPRYLAYSLPSDVQNIRALGLDLAIRTGSLLRTNSDKGAAAQKSFERDYQSYQDYLYRQQEDLFASYPVWVDSEYVVSELDFLATQSGQQISAPRRATDQPPVPEEPEIDIALPSGIAPSDMEDLRIQLEMEAARGTDQLGRYTDIIQQQEALGDIRIPSMLSPPLPFDTIIFIFVFIFPLYFSSQFFMMSIMNERTLRQGEALIASPVSPSIIILGKMLPYAGGMVLIVMAILCSVKADIAAILPLIPVILFFLSFALFIGMVSRSYKELSFISIFFSTIATSYLFFPSIFANVHIVSLLSPVTLVVHVIDGTGYTLTDYLYSTTLFYLTSIILFVVCVQNFHEEQLFTEKSLHETVALYLGALISTRYWYFSLILITVMTIPFVFMAQMMYLVLFFNLPMPFSLILIMVLAALTEELVKAAGFIGLITHRHPALSWRVVILSAFLIGFGFLLGEKLLLFATISQIADSIFGAALFLSVGLLWIPFLLHSGTVLITGITLKIWGRGALPLGVIVATIVHTVYNLYMLRGWVW